MAAVAVSATMSVEEAGKVHPFFNRPIPNGPVISAHNSSTTLDTISDAETYADCNPDKTGRADHKRKRPGRPRKSSGVDARSGRTLDSFVTNVGNKNEDEADVDNGGLSLEPDLNYERRKRHRSTETEYVSSIKVDHVLEAASDNVVAVASNIPWDQQLREAALGGPPAYSSTSSHDSVSAAHDHRAAESQGITLTSVSTIASTRFSTLDPSTSVSANDHQAIQSRQPQHMLRLNASGTFGTPKPRVLRNNPQAAKGRRRKAVRGMRVVINYASFGRGSELAERLSRILDGTERWSPRTPFGPVKKQKDNMARPPKPVHPFFLGPEATKPDSEARRELTGKSAGAKSPRPQRSTASTPGKLRAEALSHRAGAEQSEQEKRFGPRHTGLPRYPGLKDAPWPDAGSTHVRALSGSRLPTAPTHGDVAVRISDGRKGKQNVVSVPGSEDVLCQFQHELLRSLSNNRATTSLMSAAADAHDSRAKDCVLRKPKRLICTGRQLQKSVDQQLRFNSFSTHSQSHSHPALMALYSSIESDMTPFDLGVCESKAWVQKYAPKRAEEILQAGQEALLLCDWMGKSTVTAVRTGGCHSDASGKPSSIKSLASRPDRKKRRRRPDDLDGFLVSSDDEEGELDELVEVEDERPLETSKSYGITLVRGGLDVLRHPAGFRKTSNVILLSGPHGSGKTAAAYAVAQQLGFEVFEINSGTRRSGRDILDRIGDMTENHLVQQVSKMLADPKTTNEGDSAGEQLMTAKSDSKQPGLSSFFGPAAPKSRLPGKKISAKAKVLSERPLQRPRKSQKQSVILFEEVDILFEQDRHFWLTVITLSAQSRRPIILTCNDENLVPLDALKLHAILRFASPPATLAVDYLLLIAAHEGHLLERNAVQTIYEANDHDLRRSIMQLDFWCQMGVGDGKGGLEWIYQRWPPGHDVDSDGRALRVASEGTSMVGMGWFGRDLVASPNSSAQSSEFNLLRDARNEWDIVQDDIEESEWWPDDQSAEQKPSCQTLEEVALRCDLMSAADVYCLSGADTEFLRTIDPSRPQMLEKRMADYTVSYPLLEDERPTDYSDVDSLLACDALHLGHSKWHHDVSPAANARGGPRGSEQCLIDAILASKRRCRPPGLRQLSRKHFSQALDILAEPADVEAASLSVSSFDREFRVITTDLAPYIRIIAAYDLQLEAERLRLSGLLTVGGKPTKRIRTTRAARSALEGGQRQNTRRERWFKNDLNLALVLETGGRGWAGRGSLVSMEDEGSMGTAEVDDDDAYEVEH